MPGPKGFPRSERIRRRGEFLRIYRQGEKHVGAHFVCYQVRQPNEGRKMGMSVTRKVGGAVVRNRIKRYIREAYRARRSDMIDDVHLVVVARPSSARLTYGESKEELNQLFRQGKILNG